MLSMMDRPQNYSAYHADNRCKKQITSMNCKACDLLSEESMIRRSLDFVDKGDPDDYKGESKNGTTNIKCPHNA